MSEQNFLKKILERLSIGKRTSRPVPATQTNGAGMDKLLRMVEDTDDVEISCDDVLEVLDQYVEAELRGEDVAVMWPLVKRHLDRCKDCSEEYEALVRILQASYGAGS
jgi:hypothetical protein